MVKIIHLSIGKQLRLLAVISNKKYIKILSVSKTQSGLSLSVGTIFLLPFADSDALNTILCVAEVGFLFLFCYCFILMMTGRWHPIP